MMLMVVGVGLPSNNPLPIFADFIHHPGCFGNSGFQKWERQPSRHYQFKEVHIVLASSPLGMMCLEKENWTILKFPYKKNLWASEILGGKQEL